MLIVLTRPTLLSRKCWVASLLSSSSSETESFCFTKQITSSGFTPINFLLHPSGIISLFPSIRHKKAGNKQTMVAKEAARDRNYELPV